MIDDKGIFRTTMSIAHVMRPDERLVLYAGGRSSPTIVVFAEEGDRYCSVRSGSRG